MVIFIAITLYFTAIQNIQTYFFGNYIQGNIVTGTDQIYNQTNPYDQNFIKPSCAGTGSAMNFLGNILCESLTISNDVDNSTCLAISGCSVHTPGFFNNHTCTGSVNLSAYNITGNFDAPSTYCSSAGLQSQGLCNVFGCQWNDLTQVGQYQFNNNLNGNNINVFDTIRFIVSFKIDFGLPAQYNWIPNLCLLFIMFLMVILAILFLLPIW